MKAIDANFVVWEINGRNDYSYNTTMRQVKGILCIQYVCSYLKMKLCNASNVTLVLHTAQTAPHQCMGEYIYLCVCVSQCGSLCVTVLFGSIGWLSSRVTDLE